MNYLQKKKLAFMSIVNRIKGFIRTVSGVLPLMLAGCADGRSIITFTLCGHSEGVGDRTSNLIPEWKVGWIAPTTGVLNETSYPNRRYTEYILLEAGKSYTFSGTFGIYTNYTLYDENYNYLSGKSVGDTTRVVINPTGNTFVRFSHPDDSVDDFQLEEGVTATEYEPYGKYKIPIKLSGKNLIPEWKNGWIVVSTGALNENYSTRRYTDYIPIENGVSYMVSGGGTNSNWTLYDENFTFLSGQIFGSSRHINHSSARYVRIAHTNTDTNDIQLEKGSTITDYEPYHKPITTNLYVDKPLYSDEFVKALNIPTFKGTTIVSADTTIQPSNVEIEYYSNIKE